MARTFRQLIHLLRYRFLLVAGLAPYVLGNALGFYHTERFNLRLFSFGLVGMFFVLIGVEAFNEYFDWVGGTDRVFQVNPRPVTRIRFIVGLFAFGLAGLVAIYLAWAVGLVIIIIASLGFLAALFYLAPPLKLAYRGLGELTIALAYGPLMMSGSYYLQTGRLAVEAILVSVVPALLLFMIALLNEVPDYLQDGLVGKRNICVRLGREKTVKLYGIISRVFYLLFAAGLATRRLPPLAASGLIAFPLSLLSYTTARQHYDQPKQFISAIRYLLVQYIIIMVILVLVYLF
ncbi:MAG: prenyltransferase [Planctomycetota bacterium]